MKVSCLNLNNILLQLRVLYINIANLQSVTLNLGHTALIPAFLDLLFCNGFSVELFKLEANVEGKGKRRSSTTCQRYSFN